MWFRCRAAAGGVSFLAGSALTYALWHLGVRVADVFPVGGGTGVYEQLPLLPPGGWLGGLLLPLAAFFGRDRGKTLSRIAAAAAPWLLLWPGLFVPPDLAVIAVLILIIGWGGFRFGFIFGARRRRCALTAPSAWGIIAALWAVVAVCGVWTQFRAHISMFFIYSDWVQYAEHYLRLLSGQVPWRAFLAGAGHFNLLVNAVMTGALALWRRPETIFFINALCVSSAIPLTAALARKRGATPAVAAAAAVTAALNPALSHQYLGFIYGFHPTVFMIPLIFGFFLAEDRPWKWVFPAASLLVQETAAVFWFGYGLVLVASGAWKRGGTLLVLMPAFFWSVGHWLIPWALGQEQYTQIFHYAALGDSLPEAALSPLLRPRAFWGALLQWPCAQFLLAAAVPLWFAVGIRPRAALMCLPLLLGVCLQDSPQLKTIALQYSIEITTALLVVTAVVWAERLPAPRRWRIGLPPGGSSVAGSLTAVLIAGALGFFMYGCSGPFGKYSMDWGVKIPDVRPFVDATLRSCPAPGRIIASDRLHGHFIFHGPVVPVSADPRPGDLIVLEFHDPAFTPPAALHSLFLKLAPHRNVRPCVSDESHGLASYFFSREKK